MAWQFSRISYWLLLCLINMDAKNLLKQIVERERDFRNREFLAPYTNGVRHAVIKLDGINYTFKVSGFTGSGIGIFQPKDHSCAIYSRDAEWQTARAFLDLLPKLHLILCYESDQGWVAYPMNAESTAKRFAFTGEVVVKGVTDAERFDVVTSRFDGVHFWYDDLFDGADMIKSEAIREAFNPNHTTDQMRKHFDTIKGKTPEDRQSFELAIASWQKFRKQTTESQIKQTLEIGGGKLCKYVVRGSNIEIKWKSASGQDYNSLVKKDSLDVVCAGICLSHEDTKFHLKDLPFIVTRGEQGGLIYRTRDARTITWEGLDIDE